MVARLPNPITILSKMIASMHDENHITVEGFYDDVQDLLMPNKKQLNDAPFDLAEYKAELGVKNDCSNNRLYCFRKKPVFDQPLN